MTEEEKQKNNVDVGFAEECDPWLLINSYFPSKIGGKPAWLELDNLPISQDLLCGNCTEPLVFLLQVYASVEDKLDCFHRTLFVFVCRNEACWMPNSSKNIKVFRSQLPRSNKFYNYDPPEDDSDVETIQTTFSLCRVCGCRGPFVCSKCKKAFYCSAIHQKFDWKNRHKKECSADFTMSSNDTLSTLLFLEFEIALESEDRGESIEAITETEDEIEKRNKEEYDRLIATGQSGILNDVPEADLLQYSNVSAEDVTFGKFKKKISKLPDQILRYDRGGEPVWITDKNMLDSKNVQNCARCGGKRIFEFQIMPQLLNYLKDNRLDWGVITVYTCETSCNTESKYVEEFVYKQDIVNDDQ